MQPFPFTSAIDSSGSPDAITLPQDFPSRNCTIKLKPPTAHAWTFTGIGGQSIALDMDEELVLGPDFYVAGQTIGSGALDSGSGNLKGIAS